MEDFNNTSQSKCYGYNDVTAAFYLTNSEPGSRLTVVTCVSIAVSLPVTLVAIYAVYFLVQKDNVAPVYVINLLVSDLIQLCSMIISVAATAPSKTFEVSFYMYHFGVTASVSFMVCIALERYCGCPLVRYVSLHLFSFCLNLMMCMSLWCYSYLVIACPLWYRFRRTIKISLVVCVVVWTFALTYNLLTYFFYYSCFVDAEIIFDVFFLIPLPLLVFFLCGTIKALSTASRMPSDEKRRILALLVLVLLIYTLLYLPAIIWSLADKATDQSLLSELSYTFILFSPLADSFLYVFLRKGAADKLLVSLCCCKMDSNDVRTSAT